MIQLQVLNYILQNKDMTIVTLNNLNASYFSDYVDQFNYIENHFKQYGNVPDQETFMSVFPNFDLRQVNEKPSYLVGELVRDKQNRNLALLFNKMRPLLMNNQTEDAMNVLKSSIEKLQFNGVAIESVDLLKDTSRYDDFVEKSNDFNKYYISTGFKELDSVIGGWDREEELATIVARTNFGKTWVLLKSAVSAVEQGLNVGIYSGEMSAKKVGYRIDTLLGHIPNGSLTHGNIAIQNEYKQYIDELPNRFKGSLKVLTPQMINGPAGVRSLGAFIEKEHLDILFVDQHSLLEDDREAKNPVERASNISKDLKNLQVMKRIPIISVSQQNRTKNDDGKPDSTQVAQSDRISQDSTILIFLVKKDDIMEMTLGKSRDSANGITISYQVDLNTGTFNYIPTEDDCVVQDENDNVDYENRYDTNNNNEDVF